MASNFHNPPLPDRLPEIPTELMTPEQRRVMDELTSGPRGKIGGPFIPLVRSPELMSRLQKVGEYLRFHNTVGLRNSEFAVLVVARHWSQPIEWAIHRPIAEREGVLPATIDALAEGRRPTTMSDDETIIYDVLDELRNNKSVSDSTWQRGLSRFGEQGMIDMVAHYGYYSLLAMVMNISRTALPTDKAAELPRLPI
ncbi:MAG: carboxymuconolactone decarboxylase family protein [Betaproteobacteria bacterium]|nr:carboxymuconolactone decarboxylase family protein [Betaproteobacteria bacterium]NBY72719.1 carboxymuconolactone decarboxylase family protein [Betaproteobacteria bacterium]NDD11696.1 carboxymuconolactone decarboxylase family protein [Betaproteobacteria bacterium]